MATINKMTDDGSKITISGKAGNGKEFSVEGVSYRDVFMKVLDEAAGFDSETATLMHIRRVQGYLNAFAHHLVLRGEVHDDSKLGPEEKPHFDRESQLLKELEVNTPEYKESIKRLQKALTHHYKVNSHHPEHYEHGVADMTLVDVVEMLMDWKAASERGKTGYLDLESSFERFHFDPQLANIFRKTCKFFGWTTKRDIEELNSK